MYQHPIPQNVTSYQFRLVGDLTLKQFLEFLIGVGLAALFYFSNLYSPLKAVLMGASVVFGIALAFIPIEERPLDQWVIAFFKAIYRPTQFIWKKQPLLPEYFSYQTIATTQSTIETSDANAYRKQAGLTSYMQTLPTDDFYNALDTQQSEQLHYISNLFSGASSAIAQQSKSSNEPINTHPTTPPVNTSPSLSLENTQVTTSEPAPSMITTSAVSTHQSSITLPPTPETANMVTGLITTSMNYPLENAIIEILDQESVPVRATKTNKLGQFFSSTPLKNGVYSISAEADGFNPSILTLHANGNIIPPLTIRLNQT